MQTGPIVIHGLSTCDTCRRARKALAASGRAVAFRDVRAEPLGAAELAEFVAVFGDRLVNRTSATWRGLGEAERQRAPADLIAAHPTVMKRPVIRAGGALHLGWDAAVRAALNVETPP